MSVSVSQIDIDRSPDRSIDQSRFPRSVSRSVYLCLSVPVQRTTRSHFRRKVLRRIDLFFSFSLFISCPASTFRARSCHLSTKLRRVARVARSRPAGSPIIPGSRVSPSRSQAKCGRDESSPAIGLAGELTMLDVRKVAAEVPCAYRGTRQGGPRTWELERRRTMHRRAGFLERS